MSFFGDVFGAIGDVLGGVVKVVASPVELVIDAGAKLLGLPPLFADAVKVGLGALTSDWVLVADGAKDFVQDLAGEPATTEYAPPADEASAVSGWSTEGTSSAAADGSSKSQAKAGPTRAAKTEAPRAAAGSGDGDETSDDTAVGDAESAVDALIASGIDDVDAEALAAFRVLRAHFADLDRSGGPILGFGPSGVLSRDELQRISEDPEASTELKRAVRYLLDHPDTFDRFGRSKGPNDEGLSMGDLDLAIQDLSGGATSGGTSPGPAPGGPGGATSASDGPLTAEALVAFTTLRQQFDEFDHTARVGGLRLGLTPDLLTRAELQRVADDPRASGAVKQAAHYVLDHPEVWARLARSRGDLPLITGISRGDLDAALASRTLPGQGPGAPAGGVKPPATAGTKSPSSSSSSGSSASSGRKALRDILKDKTLSNEEKIEAILMVLIDEADNKLVNTAKELDDAAAKRDKLKTNDKDKLSKLDKLDRDLNFKLQRLTERKQKLETLLSNMQQKFTQMAMTAIVNLGR